MASSIVEVAANYNVRVTRTPIAGTGFFQLCKPNPSRWAIRIVMATSVAMSVTPFPGDPAYPGILIATGDDWWTYLNRDPVLTGMAWYAYTLTLITPTPTVEVWETTPVGT
jgi:hypothetical protein